MSDSVSAPDPDIPATTNTASTTDVPVETDIDLIQI